MFSKRMVPSYCFLLLVVMSVLSVQQIFVVEAGSWNPDDSDETYCQDGETKDGFPVYFYKEESSSAVFVSDVSDEENREILRLISNFNAGLIHNVKHVIESQTQGGVWFHMETLATSSIINILIRKVSTPKSAYAQVIYSASERNNMKDRVVRRALKWSLIWHRRVRISLYRRARRSDGEDVPACSALNPRSWMKLYLASIVLALVFFP